MEEADLKENENRIEQKKQYDLLASHRKGRDYERLSLRKVDESKNEREDVCSNQRMERWQKKAKGRRTRRGRENGK